MTTPDTKTLFSVQQAADYLGISAATIRRRIADGTLPATKLGTGTSTWVIEREHLDQLDPTPRPTGAAAQPGRWS